MSVPFVSPSCEPPVLLIVQFSFSNELRALPRSKSFQGSLLSGVHACTYLHQRRVWDSGAQCAIIELITLEYPIPGQLFKRYRFEPPLD
jgi:hypothetical protein